MTNETATLVGGENNRPNKKTWILADDVLIWRKDEVKEKLNQWNLIMKEYMLKMNTDKSVYEDFKKLHTNITKS
jgi:hypothetical protein